MQHGALSAIDQTKFAATQFDKFTHNSGEPPLRVREMTLQILDLGQPQDIAMPADDTVVKGSAHVMALSEDQFLAA